MHRCETQTENLVVGKHYPALDGLRGLAVILVLWFHSLTIVIQEYDLGLSLFARKYFSFVNMGNTGVDLFFIISGFLITCILIDTADRKDCLKLFYIRRVIRIFPLYFVSLILLFIIIFISGADENFANQAIAHLFFMQNWGYSLGSENYAYVNHFWSLAVEEQFYLFWPLVFLIFRKNEKALIGICVLVIAMASIFNDFFWNSGWQIYSYVNTLSRMDSLAFGALGAIVAQKYKTTDKSEAINNLRKYVKIFLMLLFFCLLWSIFESDYFYEHALQRRNHHMLVAIYLCILFIVFYADKDSLSTKIFSNKILTKAGKVSFCFYIAHWPIMMVLSEYLISTKINFWLLHVLIFFGTGLLTYMVSLLSYNYFEKPILKLKDNYSYKR